MTNTSDTLAGLSIRHFYIMESKNILVSVYTNASGFLWQMMKVDSGTDLGWSEYTGDEEWSGTFSSYNKAFKDALDLIDLSSLEEFSEKDNSHWGNFALFLRNKRKTSVPDFSHVTLLDFSNTTKEKLEKRRKSSKVAFILSIVHDNLMSHQVPDLLLQKHLEFKEHATSIVEDLVYTTKDEFTPTMYHIIYRKVK